MHVRAAFAGFQKKDHKNDLWTNMRFLIYEDLKLIMNCRITRLKGFHQKQGWPHINYWLCKLHI